MREVMFPLRWAYQGATGFRNWLYDSRWKKSVKVGAKVISVGNLTVGGTGKTPVTLALVEQMKKRGFKCGVISRGYKRHEKGVLEVDTSPKAALMFGDEPALIKATFPDIPVVVGERRVAAAQSLLGNYDVDFLICDDAFQHRAIHRDLDILLFDLTEPIKNYRVLPVGLARESMNAALRRADFVILTKSNLVEREEISSRKEWLASKGYTKPIIMAEYVLKGFRSLLGQSAKELKDKVFLVSGIAKPDALVKTLGHRVEVLKHFTYPDHHSYTDLEVEILLDEASRRQARWILTTPKDAIKLKMFSRLQERLWIVETGLEFKGDVKALYEAVDKLARKGR